LLSQLLLHLSVDAPAFILIDDHVTAGKSSQPSRETRGLVNGVRTYNSLGSHSKNDAKMILSLIGPQSITRVVQVGVVPRLVGGRHGV
jgi:hypothetical protein